MAHYRRHERRSLGGRQRVGFGSGGKDIFRGDFHKRADISIIKDTTFHKRYSLRLGMNVFNITNTPSFDTPNNNVRVNYNFAAPPTNFSIEKAFGQSSQQIGLIQHALGSPRQIQFVGRLIF